MRRLRDFAHLTLVLILSAFAVAPHQHEGLTENLLRDSVTQVGKCDAPQAHHFHASRVVHARPCIACVRQHAAGALSLTAVAIPRPVVVGTPTSTLAAPATTTTVSTPSRAPPA
jgi:hypothetical protein